MFSLDNSAKHSGASSPAASVASADIAAEFAALTVEEQEKQRAEWSQVCIKMYLTKICSRR